MGALNELGLVYFWLTVISVAQLYVLLSVSRERREQRRHNDLLAQRNAQLDIREQVHRVAELIQVRDIHKDRELREAVELLLKRLEADPLSRERHRIDILAMKDRLQ
jgi:hypothetical protein